MNENAQRCQAQRRPILIGEHTGEKTAIVYVPRCKQWSCPYCAIVNRSQWAMRIHDGVENYKSDGLEDWSFLTLTSRGYLSTFEETVKAWPKAWSRLSSRLRRKTKGLKYVLLPEQHKDGRLHVHLVTTARPTKRWLKDSSFACGLGYMADAEPLKSSKKAAWYVSKYLGKTLGVLDWPPKFRRIRTSQKWPQLEHADEDYESLLDWRIVRFKGDIDQVWEIRKGLLFTGTESVKVVIK